MKKLMFGVAMVLASPAHALTLSPGAYCSGEFEPKNLPDKEKDLATTPATLDYCWQLSKVYDVESVFTLFNSLYVILKTDDEDHRGQFSKDVCEVITGPEAEKYNYVNIINQTVFMEANEFDIAGKMVTDLPPCNLK
jgi:hypothetical protein